MDFYFRVKIFFNIKRIFGVVVGGQFIVRLLGQIVLFTQKGAHTAQLQDALSAIQHSKLIAAHKFPAVKSSDEFAKEKTLPVKNEKGHYIQCYTV